MGPASISNLAKDLRRILTHDSERKLDPISYTIEQVVTLSHQFLRQRYNLIDPLPPSPHAFEFWVGGYGSGCDNAEVWKLSLVDGVWAEPEQIADQQLDGHVAWGGQPQAIQRLILGCDPNIIDVLVRAGVPDDTVGPLWEQIKDQLQTPLVNSAMPIADAISLAEFLVDLSKRYFAFLPGADTVGGATDIATVTKHEGFKWIRRKHYYPLDLNPRETDHV